LFEFVLDGPFYLRSWPLRLTQEQIYLRVRSLDHLVGAGEERVRHLDAERLGGLEIDSGFKFRGVNSWNIDGPRPFRNFPAPPWRGGKQPSY
jgi:hypothetical protein